MTRFIVAMMVSLSLVQVVSAQEVDKFPIDAWSESVMTLQDSETYIVYKFDVRREAHAFVVRHIRSDYTMEVSEILVQIDAMGSPECYTGTVTYDKVGLVASYVHNVDCRKFNGLYSHYSYMRDLFIGKKPTGDSDRRRPLEETDGRNGKSQ